MQGSLNTSTCKLGGYADQASASTDLTLVWSLGRQAGREALAVGHMAHATDHRHVVIVLPFIVCLEGKREREREQNDDVASKSSSFLSPSSRFFPANNCSRGTEALR